MLARVHGWMKTVSGARAEQNQVRAQSDIKQVLRGHCSPVLTDRYRYKAVSCRTEESEASSFH